MIGQTLSHYRIDAELGRGGMGVVYRAHDERLQRSVALKLLPEQISGHAEQRARILAEARAAAALNHPGITTIYEVGEEGEQIFLVMELVVGKALRALAAEGAMELRRVARLGALVAEALAAAHAQGVIHGDVKPENIVVQPDERVKLLDFGIARQIASETVTRTLRSAVPVAAESQISGTLAYMAPEMLRGEPTDARADLFSLGVVLYELAAGRRPFPGPTVTALFAQILHEAPAPLAGTGAVPGVPAEFQRIVGRLLEKQPESRYLAAREVQVDLTNLARDLDLGVVPPAALAGRRAVAVLPFKLLTPSVEDEYLSVALADAVINRLSAGGDLLVRPTSTVQRYAKQPADPLGVAREQNVQVVVDGSIQKFGEKIRVHVQVWNAADGSSILSAKHDAEMAGLFRLQDELSDGLARVLGAKPGIAAAQSAPPTKNRAAYELFLRAAERLARNNRWDTRTAIEMLEQATALDPHFPDAWARLAEAYILMGVTLDPNPAWFRRAEQAIRRALALDPHNAEAQCARGRVLWTPIRGFQNRAALRALNQALRINPGCHSAQIWRCLIWMHVGLLEEAREGLFEALATQPDDAFTLNFAGQTALYSGKFEEGDEYQARALSLDPANLWASIFYPTIPIYDGRLDEAEQRIRVARRTLPKDDPWMMSLEALLWAKRGEMRRALQMTGRSLRSRKALLHTHHLWHTAAATYALAGKPAEAVSLLKRCGQQGLPNYPAFRDDPHFVALRNYAPFQRLLAQLQREWKSLRSEFGRGA